MEAAKCAARWRRHHHSVSAAGFAQRGRCLRSTLIHKPALTGTVGLLDCKPGAPGMHPSASIYEGQLTTSQPEGEAHISIGIVSARFNSLITDRLLAGALSALGKAGLSDDACHIAYVPGSFEIPVVAKAMAKSGCFDAIICIGAVVRGATTHYEEVCSAATSGCSDAGASTGVPVIFGVVTTEDMEQALDRAGGKAGNKGYEAAVTAVEMATLMRTLRRNNIAAASWGSQAVGPTS